MIDPPFTGFLVSFSEMLTPGVLTIAALLGGLTVLAVCTEEPLCKYCALLVALAGIVVTFLAILYHESIEVLFVALVSHAGHVLVLLSHLLKDLRSIVELQEPSLLAVMAALLAKLAAMRLLVRRNAQAVLFLVAVALIFALLVLSCSG